MVRGWSRGLLGGGGALTLVLVSHCKMDLESCGCQSGLDARKREAVTDLSTLRRRGGGGGALRGGLICGGSSFRLVLV